MKSMLFGTLLFLSFSSMSAEIKKISETEFEFHNDDGHIKNITIESSLGAVEFIAAVRQDRPTRLISFLIKTSSGNCYLHHSGFSLNPSPEAIAHHQFSQNNGLTPTFIPTASLSGIELTPPLATFNLQPIMQTTLLTNVQRSSSGDQVHITPAIENECLASCFLGTYTILSTAHFNQYGKSDTVFSF